MHARADFFRFSDTASNEQQQRQQRQRATTHPATTVALCVVTIVAKSGGTFSRATSCATGGRETKESQRNARPFTRWPITESRARRAPHVDDYCSSIRVRTCAYMHKGIRNACVSLSRRLVVTRCAATTKQTYCNAQREKQELFFFFFFFLVACESHAGARTAFSVIYGGR